MGRVVDDLPAPTGDLRTMSWDGECFWVLDRAGSRALAMATDGTRRRTVDLPAPVAIEPEVPAQVWGEFSAVAAVGDRLYVGNVYCGGVHGATQQAVDPHPHWLAGGFTVDMANQGDGLWHIDACNRLLIQSEPEATAKLLDWAGAPFGSATVGLAWDGTNLWALDGARHRIARLERLAA